MAATPEPRTIPLPLPVRGQSVLLRVGQRELVVEQRRSGLVLLCLDGSAVRTWCLGLPRQGTLELEHRVPRWPLRVSLRETLVLLPGGRVRGYVVIPLVPTVLFRRRSDDAAAVVTELLPGSLGAEWDEVAGECIQRVEASLLQRLPPAAGQPQAVVPLVVNNRSPHVQSPGTLPLALRDDELRPVRGHWLAQPRRLVLDSNGRWTTLVRTAAARMP